MRIRLAAALCLVCGAAFCQTALDNGTIVKLVKAGLSDDTVILMINQQPGRYALSSDDTAQLRTAGVTDRVIAAMVVRNNANSARPPVERAVDPARIRVYVGESQSWEMRGGWQAGGFTNSVGAGRWGGGGYQAGGARPQTAEIVKTFNQRCSDVVITNNVGKADYAVTLDHEGGKGYLHRRNKIVVFNRNGDAIFSDSTRALGNSVKDACDAIMKDAGARTPSVGAALHGPDPAQTEPSNTAEVALREPGLIEVAFTSNPPGALVTIYGTAIGRTPFSTKLQPGTYKAVFAADGYYDLTQSVTVGPGHSNIVSAAFESR